MPQDGMLGAENMDCAHAASGAPWEQKADRLVIILKEIRGKISENKLEKFTSFSKNPNSWFAVDNSETSH